MQNNEIFHVIGTDLLDYSFKVEQAIKEGWTFSTENQYAPRAWPHMFEAFMVRIPKEDELQVKSLAEIKEDFAKQQEVELVANIATNVAEKTTKQVNRRGVKK